MADVYLVKLLSDEHHWTLQMISQHWFRQWLGAVRQQAITWANVDQDLCRHMASLSHNELTLATGECGNNFKCVISEYMLVWRPWASISRHLWLRTCGPRFMSRWRFVTRELGQPIRNDLVSQKSPLVGSPLASHDLCFVIHHLGVTKLLLATRDSGTPKPLIKSHKSGASAGPASHDLESRIWLADT